MHRITFEWNIILECNYRCPYCWFDSKWEELKNKFHPSSEDLVKYWSSIYKRYGSVDINVLGGEPFLYPNFVELIKELSAMHTLRIQSNLSLDIDTFVKEMRSSNVGLGGTFHPLFADFDVFLKKAMMLKKNGFSNTVVYLAYPPQIKMIDYYRRKFKQAGLSLSVFTFWGKYKGNEYPVSYTEDEIKLIEPYLGDRAGERFQIIPKKVKGLLCNAGHLHAVVNSDGRVNRCGGVAADEIIGNFYDDNFSLLDGPEPCNCEYCPCNEWAFLLLDKKV